jgi:hypothetical protein
MAKRGPKGKIDAEMRAKIFGALAVGASIVDAAEAFGIDRSTIHRLKVSSKEFATGALRAEKSGMLKHLKKINGAKQWQAAAWMLERKWSKKFGRKDVVKNHHSGRITFNPITFDGDKTAIDPGAEAAGAVPETEGGNSVPGSVHGNRGDNEGGKNGRLSHLDIG